MTASNILRWCVEHNVQLRAECESLRWSAPKGIVTEGIKRILCDHKGELLSILKHEGEAATVYTLSGSSCLHGGAPSVVEERRVESPLVGMYSINEAEPRWIKGEALEKLPEPLQGLVCERSGWAPASWASYLERRARACDPWHWDVAERYEAAAKMLLGGPK